MPHAAGPSRHPLDALFAPRSIAVVGASARPESNGHAMLAMATVDGFDGRVLPVNPRYSQIDGVPCAPRLTDLSHTPDHVVIGVASSAVEPTLDEAIELGVRAVTIFASCQVPEDPGLLHRLADKARHAGVAICGPNCMGFYNPISGLRVASFHSPPGLRHGPIAWISQSGSTFGALAHNDRRLGFSLCVSTGAELTTTAADALDWSIDQGATRVAGLFLETVRKPERFATVLRRAAEQDIPVVILKVARTAKSAAMALSHTGAIAGDDVAFTALCRHYGVTLVADMDEMAATLALFGSRRRAAKGHLATVHDSGGERELIVDMVEDLGVGLAEITKSTAKALRRNLEPGLRAENPLDAFATTRDYVGRYTDLIADLTNDRNVALGLFMANPRDDYWYAAGYAEAVLNAAQKTQKPLALVSNYSMVDDSELAIRLAKQGIPLIRGSRNALLAAKHVMARRDFSLGHGELRVSKRLRLEAARWRKAMESGPEALPEHEGLVLLNSFGLTTPAFQLVSTVAEVSRALDDIPSPWVLKTAEDIAHKSDVGGVKLNLTTRDEVHDAYRDLADRLGPRALLMASAGRGIELCLGAVFDDTFGPVVVLSAGGVLVELLEDKAARLAPFDRRAAHALMTELRIARLLEGYRGQAAADMSHLCDQISRFSQMVAAFQGGVAAIDVNPLIATPNGCWAVDCLVVRTSGDEADVAGAMGRIDGPASA